MIQLESHNSIGIGDRYHSPAISRPSCAGIRYLPGDSVRVYCEKERKFTGPFLYRRRSGQAESRLMLFTTKSVVLTLYPA